MMLKLKSAQMLPTSSTLRLHFSNKGPAYSKPRRNYNLDKKTDEEGWRPRKVPDYAFEKPKVPLKPDFNNDSNAKQEITKHNPVEPWKKSLRKFWHGSKEGNVDDGFNIPFRLKNRMFVGWFSPYPASKMDGGLTIMCTGLRNGVVKQMGYTLGRYIGGRLMRYKWFAKAKALIGKMAEPYDEGKKPRDDNIMRPMEHLVIYTEELIQWYFPVPGIDIEDCKHNIDLNGLLTIKAKNAEECYQYAVQLLWDDADFDRAIVTKRIVKGYLVVDVTGFKKSS